MPSTATNHNSMRTKPGCDSEVPADHPMVLCSFRMESISLHTLSNVLYDVWNFSLSLSILRGVKVHSGRHVQRFGAIFCLNPQGRIVSLYPEEGDGMHILNPGPICQTTKCKQSQKQLFAMKKAILDSFETPLTHSKACCVTLSEYRNTQKHLFWKLEPFSTIISYSRPVAQWKYDRENAKRLGTIHVFISATKLVHKMHDAWETLASGIPCLSEANVRRRLRNEATLKFSGVCRDVRVIVMSCNCELVIISGKRKNFQWATEFTHIKGMFFTRAGILNNWIQKYMSIKICNSNYVVRSNSVCKIDHLDIFS